MKPKLSSSYLLILLLRFRFKLFSQSQANTVYNDWLNPNEILKGNKHSYLSLCRLCIVSICFFLSWHIRILDIMVNFEEISKLDRNIS